VGPVYIAPTWAVLWEKAEAAEAAVEFSAEPAAAEEAARERAYIGPYIII